MNTVDLVFSLLWTVVIVGIVGGNLFKFIRNRKAAQSGEDKARLCNAADMLQGKDGNNPILFAHWEERESYGRTVKTTYFRYVVSFQDEMLYVAPLYIDKKTRQMQMGQLTIYTADQLGKIEVTSRQKNGAADHLEIVLDDKKGQTLFQFHVDAKNTRKNRFYPVNILQYEECAAFERFINALAQRVAAENPGIDEIIKANGNEGFGVIGAIVSVIGAVISFFFPPAGIFLGLIGLCLAIVTRIKGARGIAPLIISIICFIWCSGFLWLYITIM